MGLSPRLMTPHRLLFVALFVVTSARAGAAEKYVLISPAGPIGTLTIEQKAGVVSNTWNVDDNGRGSKLVERAVLEKDGRPRTWELEGKGWFGAPVKERFAIEGGKAQWISLDDHGEADGKDALYLVNNGTPYSLAVYLKVLLASKGLTHAVLPSGTLRLEKLREVEVGAGKTKEKLTAYALWGLDLAPSFLLARKNQLVASLSPGWVTVEERHQADYEALSTLATELSGAAMQKLTSTVRHPIEGALWITNVHVFDSETGKVGPLTSVGVFRDRIVAVGEPAPADAQRVDGGGGTLLPGLIDSHAHLGIWDGPLHLASGVTFARDPGNDNAQLLSLEQHLTRGDFVGPRVKRSGFLEGQSQFSAHLGFVIDSEQQALEKVRWYADHGFWGVKIYNSMNPDFVKGIAAEAHRLGLHVSGHVPAFMSSTRALEDGYDEINHINQLVLSLMIDVAKEDTRTPLRFTALGERSAKLDLKGEPFQKLVKLLKDKKATLEPTMATFASLVLARPGTVTRVDAAWLSHAPATVQRARATALLDVPAEKFPLYDASWKRLGEALLALHQAGVPLVPGTDDVAGLMLHSELEEWVKAGISPADTLRAATLGGARFLGLEVQQGTIARGKRADLYLVEGDPTQDISVIRKGRLTLEDGVFYYPDELHQALGITPFAARAVVKDSGK